MENLNLTAEQISTLKMVLLLTTRHRKNEEDACKRLGTELNEAGTLKYPNMKLNGEWWEQTNAIIEEIVELI